MKLFIGDLQIVKMSTLKNCITVSFIGFLFVNESYRAYKGFLQEKVPVKH